METNKKEENLIDIIEYTIAGKCISNCSAREAAILCNNLFKKYWNAQQHSISNLEIENMAEKEYPLELWSAENQIVRKLAFIKGYKAYTLHGNSGVWVKADERLPNKAGIYFLLLDKMGKETDLFIGGKFEKYDIVHYKEIEWLDESQLNKQ